MASPSPRSPITCHVLDANLGCPGQNVGVFIETFDFKAAKYVALGQGETDKDGRCNNLLAAGEALSPGLYKITFKTGEYFMRLNREAFYPVVEISFHVAKPTEHYHIPLLLSPWSYTTYRGS